VLPSTDGFHAAPVNLAGNETILLIEDEPSLRDMVRRALTATGYTVIAAADGAEGIRLSEQRSEPVDLVLTDMILPGMSGRELSAEFRRRLPGLPIIIMSGYTGDSPWTMFDGTGNTFIVSAASHFTNARIQPDPVCKGIGKPFDIVAAAADDGLPGRTLPQLQQAMVMVETNKGCGWIRQHFRRCGRPDRACHRQQMVVAKGRAISTLQQVIAEADLFVVDQIGSERGLTIEMNKVREHRPEARTDQVARLSENP